MVDAMTQPLTAKRNQQQALLIQPSSVPQQRKWSHRFQRTVRKAAGLVSATGALLATGIRAIRTTAVNEK